MNIVQQLSQQPLGVVTFAEEAPVQRAKPTFAVAVRYHRQGANHDIDPATTFQQISDRLVVMLNEVQHQQSGRQRPEPQQRPARHRVLQPLPHYHAHI